MKIRYTRRALVDLRLISEYIRQHVPQGADRARAIIQDQLARLETHPNLGRATAKRDIRILTITQLPYVVYYQIDEDAVLILHVRHQRRAPFDPATL